VLPWRVATVIVGAGLLVGLTACGDDDAAADGSADTAGATSSTAEATTTTEAPRNLYVSLGDSYASGYQPDVGNTTNGFAYQVPELAADRGYDLELVNFACAGATSESMLRVAGCPPERLGPDGVSYDDAPQAAAAEAFVAEHADEIDLITVSIGGNDVTACVTAPDPIPCITTAMTAVSTNLPALLQGLRAAAGPDVPIVGLTYPNVVLAGMLSPDPADRQLADLSVVAFRSLINPALRTMYEAVDATFIDVTEASGSYGALTETTTVEPYGEIPTPVARICELTFMCDRQDIHPTTVGYTLIATLVAESLPPQ
jgi:lysophospholipase L1-like esterase